jgi:Xaa-Pro aminopeptidase
MALDITAIQSYLSDNRLDAWLLADFHGRNTIATAMLNLSGLLTRRSFYLIPATGEPTALVNPIEAEKFRHLPGQLIAYRGWKGLEQHLGKLLSGCKTVAMEYSENGRLPYVGLVEAGTVELVRSLKVNVVSSADLVASFKARLSPAQVAAHRTAANNVILIKSLAHKYISESIKAAKHITEYDVVRFIMNEFDRRGMETAFEPNCSVDANAGDPHYQPKPDTARPVERGQLVLIDLWAKLIGETGVYADITWMAFTGSDSEIPQRYHDIFEVLTKARDTAVDFLQRAAASSPLCGAEVDDVCREVIDEAGYGEFFTHRTGHSITTHEHGEGPNIDNLETEDRRVLQPGHLFSIEPGIYMPDCGFRTEINVLMTPGGAEITTLPLQHRIVALFD